ncbi:MAG: enolase C-terminal domain-like protein [Acidobacteriota bacterium]
MLYRAISQQSPEEMAGKVSGYRSEGYSRFQLKAGGDPETDIERIKAVSRVLEQGDVLIAANTGWLMHEAARVVRGVFLSLFNLFRQPLQGYFNPSGPRKAEILYPLFGTFLSWIPLYRIGAKSIRTSGRKR